MNNIKWWSSFLPSQNEEYNNYKSNRYYYKSNALLDSYNIDYLRNKLIISSVSGVDKDNKNIYKFTFFDTYIDFAKYQAYIKPINRCCFEYIQGIYPQKPHFDIDINLVEHNYFDNNMFIELRNELIASIDSVLIDNNVEIDLYKDICIYTSHSSKKMSCHIIVDHYYHANNIEAKAFYNSVVNRMTPEYKQFIDNAVYSSRQQFRIIGNQKFGSNRPKIFHTEWDFNGTRIKYIFNTDSNSEFNSDKGNVLYMIKSSLISWIEDCKPLPIFRDDEKIEIDVSQTNCINYMAKIKHTLNNKSNTIYNYDNNKLNKDEVISTMNIFTKYIKQYSKLIPFKIDRVNGSSIFLKRIYKSYCPVCDTNTHESIGSYLIITGYNRQIRLMCHRDETKKKIHIGYLGELDSLHITIDNESQSNISTSNTNDNNNITTVNLNYKYSNTNNELQLISSKSLPIVSVNTTQNDNELQLISSESVNTIQKDNELQLLSSKLLPIESVNTTNNKLSTVKYINDKKIKGKININECMNNKKNMIHYSDDISDLKKISKNIYNRNKIY